MSTPIGFPTIPDCGCNVILPMDKKPCVGDTLDVMFYNISALNVAFQKYIKRGAGKVNIFAGSPNNVPADELICDGGSFDPASYPQLFTIIGYRHGRDGNNFRVPDYRGQFLRGVDMGAGNDPDADDRTEPYAGGVSGDEVGSCQSHALQQHRHAGGIELHSHYFTVGPGNVRRHYVLCDHTNHPSIENNTKIEEVTPSPDCNDQVSVACETRPVNKNVLFTITTGECYL